MPHTDSEKTEEEVAKNIYKSYQRLRKLQTAGSGLDMEMAKELAYQKRDGRYKIIMGDEDASWRSFVAQPDLQPLTVSKADRLVKVYETYVEKLRIRPVDLVNIDSNSLLRMANFVTPENVQEWLDKAKYNSRSDLYREIRFGKINESECEHPKGFIVKRECPICGWREKVIAKPSPQQDEN